MLQMEVNLSSDLPERFEACPRPMTCTGNEGAVAEVSEVSKATSLHHTADHHNRLLS